MPSAVRHTRTAPSTSPLMMTGVPPAAPRPPSLRAVGRRSGSPPDAVAVRHTRTAPPGTVAAADDDRGAVRQRPRRRRVHRVHAWPDDLVASGAVTVGPAGLPGPVRGGARDPFGQVAAAEAAGGSSSWLALIG